MATQTTRPLTPSQAARMTDPRDITHRLLPRVEAWCKANPWTAIGFGLALGVLLHASFFRR